ncbi:MAG TPA: septum formation initiator family protein [Rhizomicrobium sp.]|nr:septum formation initiator family protein [Rhizomicrobium sp.]
MRIRRSVKDFFGRIVIPAISIAVAGYFGYYALNGPRGWIAYQETGAQLEADKTRLAALHDQNGRLRHRIDLLQDGHVDYDLVEELARGSLVASSPDEVAVPRRRPANPVP